VKSASGHPVPVFPLPNVVLYPRIVLPLHVFEPRYRALLSDSLDGHGRIAMALLKPGWEEEYHGAPEVHPVVGVGSIVTYRRRDDGTSDVILVGEHRARIAGWDDGGKEYRRAYLVELKESPPPSSARKALRRRLQDWLSSLTSEVERNSDLERLRRIFAEEDDIGFLIDFLAYYFLKAPGEKQRLLEELAVDHRAEMLSKVLDGRGGR
jgi:Lon protease-like protein